jgi:hypothetical protein
MGGQAMRSLPKVEAAVQHVLKMKAKNGQTTKQDAAQLVWRKIENTGGPGAYGIGRAAVTMACLHIIETEVTRQFKIVVSEHVRQFIIPKHMPMEIVRALDKIPGWIAIEEGRGALWKYSLKATSQDWDRNFEMKDKKAEQTHTSALLSLDISRFLASNGVRTLGQIFINEDPDADV